MTVHVRVFAGGGEEIRGDEWRFGKLAYTDDNVPTLFRGQSWTVVERDEPAEEPPFRGVDATLEEAAEAWAARDELEGQPKPDAPWRRQHRARGVDGEPSEAASLEEAREVWSARVAEGTEAEDVEPWRRRRY